MTLMRRPTSFPAFSSLREEMDQMMSRFFGQPFEMPTAWMPPLNMEEKDNEVVVTVELPGIDAKDVSVSVDDRDLVISGEKKTTHTEKKPSYRFEEIRYGSFYRRIPLPADVMADKTSADYKKGVLQVTLPKAHESRVKKVPVATTEK